MSDEREFGREAILRRIGQLAQQRRGELAAERGYQLGRVAFAKMAGIGSDSTVRDFEQGSRLPNTLTLRRMEKALGWAAGSIERVMSQVNRRPSDISMEDLDEFDSEDKRNALSRVGTLELIEELKNRLEDLQGTLGKPDVRDLYGLAASTNQEHLEDEVDRQIDEAERKADAKRMAAARALEEKLAQEERDRRKGQ